MLVLEGAGSPAEINLRDRDIVNMGMAEMAQCPVVLVADIDRGGVFASIYGTLALLHDHERARVKGVIINKFRGDVTLLHSGIEQIEALTGVPVLGVMPWLDVDLEDEDGVALQRASICALINATSTSPLCKYRTFLTLRISMRLLRSRMCVCAMFASLKSWRGPIW